MHEVRTQYELWPYPNIPLFARVPREQLWQINAAWIAKRAGQTPSERASIWIAGCGTFQPYVFSQANPGSEILATDISKVSLDIAKKRCAYHRKKNITFQQIDLSLPETYPKEKFDLIECYGVLMCLPNPKEALREMAKRLKPNGVLRIMVYPHYGRQRIFQIQRLAKLLGLHFQQKAAPQTLRKVIDLLPEEHPLSYAFDSYKDSQNPQGIVDAFLHASDRAFTGVELSHFIEAAGLDLAFAVHRPWGQPRQMAERLGLIHHDPALWLHYLDLWQSLRTNYILCLVPSAKQATQKTVPFHHPLFSLDNPALGVKDRVRLLKMAALGTTLESRTAEKPLELNSKEVRELLKGHTSPLGSESEIHLQEVEPVLGKPFVTTRPLITPNKHWTLRAGAGAPNPLYAHLFDAFVFQDQWKSSLGQALPNLEDQMARWRKYAEPLEDDTHPFGLTPFGTYEHNPEQISTAAQSFLTMEEVPFSEVQWQDLKAKHRQVNRFLDEISVDKNHFTEAELTELWVILFSYEHLFLDGNSTVNP